MYPILAYKSSSLFFLLTLPTFTTPFLQLPNIKIDTMKINYKNTKEMKFNMISEFRDIPPPVLKLEHDPYRVNQRRNENPLCT